VVLRTCSKGGIDPGSITDLVRDLKRLYDILDHVRVYAAQSAPLNAHSVP